MRQLRSESPVQEKQAVQAHVSAELPLSRAVSGRALQSERKSELCVMECNDDCLIKKRSLALGASEKESYSEELVEFARTNAEFVSKVENKLERIVKGQEKVSFLPPMKEKQRWLCHELASNHYKLDTESLDTEPYRSVYLYLTSTARVPTPLLSEFTALVGQGVEVEFEKKESVASLLFYQLSASVSTDDLNEVLQKYAGDFYIKWENDHSAFAHFFSIHKCSEARKQLERSPGQYSVVKMIVNDMNEDTTGFKKRFRNSKKAKEVTSFDDVKEDEGIVELKPVEKMDLKKKVEKIIEDKKGTIFEELMVD
jgi:hypothetical protein